MNGSIRLAVAGAFVAAFAALFAAAPASAQTRMMPTPAITIYPGETIKESVITQREFAAAAIGDLPVVEAAGALIGKVARRTLLPGQLVPRNAVEDARLVERGSPVQVVFDEGGLTIVAIASPLQSGGLGDMVRARNLDSGVTIVGRVQADGTLRVGE